MQPAYFSDLRGFCHARCWVASYIAVHCILTYAVHQTACQWILHHSWAHSIDASPSRSVLLCPSFSKSDSAMSRSDVAKHAQVSIMSLMKLVSTYAGLHTSALNPATEDRFNMGLPESPALVTHCSSACILFAAQLRLIPIACSIALLMPERGYRIFKQAC